ncbi:MAG TPA: hypothetical protein VF183_15260 [Acidimicrobiales bacterium]
MQLGALVVVGSSQDVDVPCAAGVDGGALAALAQQLGVPIVRSDASDDSAFPSITWTDPRDGRTIGRHAFARFRCHAAAWRVAASHRDPVLVMEAGAQPVPDAAAALASIERGDWDVLLLDAAASAYVCTPQAAQELCRPHVLDDAVPVDVALLSVPRSVVRAEPELVQGAHPNDDEVEHGHLVQLNFGDRRELADKLAELDPRTLVVAVAHEHVALGSVDELLATYAAVGAGAVVVAATGTAPSAIDPALVEAHPDTGTSYRFVAAVAIAGPAGAILDALAGRDDGDDAVALTGAYLDGLVALDSSCALFHVPRGMASDAVAVHHRLVVGATGATPLYLVCGDDRDAFDRVRATLADDGARDLARIFRYDDAVDLSPGWSCPAPDIVQVPFWTPELCATVIRLAEAAEAWDRDEDDPVPGAEVSLAALSPRLFGHLGVHLRERVLPVLRQVWPELADTDLHDAFVIKYAAGPHAELRLHHDVAQISGTVRLNDGYEGGRLEFPRQGWDNRAVPIGNLVVWPSLVTHPHRSTPVTAGVKYGLTLWWKLPG